MSTVCDSLIDAINDDAFAELETEVVIEKVEIPVINNDETIKKIEDSRKFLTAESSATKESFGLKSKDSTQTKSVYETTRASTTSTSTSSTYGYKSTETSYRYGYSVQEKETLQTKASKATLEAFNKIKERVDRELKNESLKSNWNVLEIMDDEKIRILENKAKPKKVLTPEQIKKKLFWSKLKISAIKLAMEVLYITYKERS